MLPFSFAGGVPNLIGNSPSLLHSVVKSNRPSLCGNATVRVLIQYKWQAFGRELFVKEMGYYCLGLLLLMTLLFIRSNPFDELTARELLSGSGRDKTTFVVTVVVLLGSLFTLFREYHQISVVGVKSYFLDDWKNFVDLAVILLT
jgi:hypothetical protein